MKNILFLFLLLSATSYALDASYDGGEELILVERMPIDIKYGDTRRKYVYPNTIPLGSIYWDGSVGANKRYFYVKDGTLLTKTNGLTYKLDPVKQQEPSIGEPQDTQLVYAGYISTNQRLYIDPKTKEQFIKTLIPIIDEPFQIFATPSLSYYSLPIGWFEMSYNAENIFYFRNSTNGKLEEILE